MLFVYSSFNDIETESKLINDLLKSAKLGDFKRVWQILGDPNDPKKKCYLMNCIPDNRRWGVVHQAVFWNDPDVLNKILQYQACDSDMRAKRCTSECGETSGMCALEIARAYKYPKMDQIMSAHKNHILGQKLPTFQKQIYLGLISIIIASYKSAFHPGYISPFKHGLEVLSDMWKDISKSDARFEAVKKVVCDAITSYPLAMQ